MRLKWLALAVVLLLPFSVDAATCRFTGSGDWTSATTYSGTIVGCTSGVDLSADDSIEIETGATATITTGSTVSMTIGLVTVESGGTLVIARGGNLAVPDAGLVVAPGGTFTPQGVAISYGDATPSLVTALSDGGGVDVNTVLPVGKVIHCPGATTGTGNIATATTAITSDCTGALVGGANTPGVRSQIAICYPDANVTAERIGGFQASGAGAIGEGFYPEFVAQVAAGDVVVFWDSTNKNPSRDVNAQYEVDFVNTNALNRCIGLNVRQGTTVLGCAAGSKNCALDDRDVREVTLQTAYVAGQTSVDVDAAAITSTAHRAGHFVTCPSDYGTGTASPNSNQSVAIVHTLTGATDTLQLMPGGFRHSVPISTTCFIDYGWTAGDLFSVYKPARISNIQNATCADNDNPVVCCDGANFGECGPITCGRGASCDFDFTVGTGHGRITLIGSGQTMDNTWFKEQGNGRQFIFAESAGPITRVQSTSSRYNAGHVFVTGGGGNPLLRDIVARHWSDDLILLNYCTVLTDTTCAGGWVPGLDVVHGMTIQRMRAEYNGCGGETCQILDEGSTTGAINVSITDLLARDATERTANVASFLLFNTTTPGLAKVTNATFIANGGEFFIPSGGTASRLEVRNIYDVGRIVTSVVQPVLRAHVLHDASLIGVSNNGASGYLLHNPGLVGAVSWNRILMLDPDLPGANPIIFVYLDQAGPTMDVKDLAIISPNRTGQTLANSVFRMFAGAAHTNSVLINRLTIAMRPGETTEATNALLVGGNDAPYDNNHWKVQNALLAHYWPASGTANATNIEGSDIEVVTPPWCFQSNNNDLASGPIATLTSAVRDTRQPFVDPTVGNFTPKKTSLFHEAGCGARNVGAADMWALRVLGHDIYAGHGDTWKVKTGGGNKRGPRATP